MWSLCVVEFWLRLGDSKTSVLYGVVKMCHVLSEILVIGFLSIFETADCRLPKLVSRCAGGPLPVTTLEN